MSLRLPSLSGISLFFSADPIENLDEEMNNQAEMQDGSGDDIITIMFDEGDSATEMENGSG